MMPKAHHRAVIQEIEKLVRQCTCFRAVPHVPHEAWCLFMKADRVMRIVADSVSERILMGRETV